MVVRSGGIAASGDQLRATDQADHIAVFLLVRALLHLDQPSRRVIVVVYPLGQSLAEQPSLPGAPVQAVILIAYHSAQTVAHPHQPVLLIIAEGQRVDAAPGTLPVLEGQETFLLLTSLNP